jgi:hypothetical protein
MHCLLQVRVVLPGAACLLRRTALLVELPPCFAYMLCTNFDVSASLTAGACYAAWRSLPHAAQGKPFCRAECTTGPALTAMSLRYVSASLAAGACYAARSSLPYVAQGNASGAPPLLRCHG